MITLYKLFDLTGIHPHSKTRWFRKNFGYTTKQAKSVEFVSYKIAYDFLVAHSKKPDVAELYKFFPESINAIQTPELIFEKKTCTTCQHFLTGVCLSGQTCNNNQFWKTIEMELVQPTPMSTFIPEITKEDYEILKNSFDDLLEMYRGLEARVLIIEKRTELPKRAYRIEVINLINEIARKHNKSQQSLYTDIYKGFDSRYNISDETKKKETKMTYMEWYDKHDYLPKLLNYIKETYKL